MHTEQNSELMLFMGSTEALDVFRLFQRSVPVWLLRELSRKHGYGLREGIYGASVVIWLMIWQRLQGSRSQQAAVQYLLQGGADEMQIDCKRWNEDRVSASTGGYSTARQRLPGPIVREVTERMAAHLRVEMEEGWEGLQRPVFVVDGTTLQLRHEPDLEKAYCPGRNQHGENHWPVMQVLVMHDVYSGMAMAPSGGPMYGDAAVSEQAMAVAALDKLPPDAALLGDANFGVFAFAHAVHRSGRPMILRLSQPRARNILGEALKEGTDRKLVWRPSLWDRKSHPELPAQACVEGRVLVCRHPGCLDELLCLFTTLELPTAALEGGNRPAIVKTDCGHSSVEQQESGHGGERIIAGNSGLQSDTRRHVSGGTPRRHRTTPTQFFVRPIRGGSGFAGSGSCFQRRGIQAAPGTNAALCRTGKASASNPPAWVSA